MTINSLEFLLFVAIVCVLYFMIPKKQKWILLLFASYFFYYVSSAQLAIFLGITTISIYISALWMGKIEEQTKQQIKNLEKDKKKEQKEKAKQKKKWIVALTLALNFGILIVLKYGNFFCENLNFLLERIQIPLTIPGHNFLLPLGISYYTLQATSYVIDVYRGKYKPDKHFGRVALFVSFFPQIVEGPIGRYDKLAKQLYEPHSFDYTRVKWGIQLMLWGFFKKMVIADRAALFVNEVFSHYAEYSGIVILLSIILYTIQIYTEFSGCMDIIRGISEIMGITLEKNFERPFFSKSVQEFWRRWNITLGTWLKEYVFYCVSFSKPCIGLTGMVKKFSKGTIGKLIPAAFSLFFVWFFNGLWHGASWKYIAYGLYYYVIMMLGMLLEPVGKKIITILRIKTDTFSYRLWQRLRTTGFVLFGMLLFRAPHLKVAWEMLKSIPTIRGMGKLFNGSLFSIGWKPSDVIILVACIGIVGIVSILQEKGYSIRKEIEKQNLVFRWLCYYTIFFAIVVFGIYGSGYNVSNFIYGQF